MPTVTPNRPRRSSRTIRAPERLVEDDITPLVQPVLPPVIEKLSEMPLNGDDESNCSTKNNSDEVVFESNDKPVLRNSSVEEEFIEESCTTSPGVSDKSSAVVNHASLKYNKSDLYERWVRAREDLASTKIEAKSLSYRVNDLNKEVSGFKSKLRNHESLVEKNVNLLGEINSLKLKLQASDERQRNFTDKLKTAAKQHKQDLQCAVSKHELAVETTNLSHENIVGKLKYELKEKDLELRSTVAQISKLQDEIKCLQHKSKKYDEISAQGVKALIQNRAYNERASVR